MFRVLRLNPADRLLFLLQFYRLQIHDCVITTLLKEDPRIRKLQKLNQSILLAKYNLNENNRHLGFLLLQKLPLRK